MSQSQQLTIEQAISQAEKMARQGNVAVARQLYRAVLQHQPNHPIATNALRLMEKSYYVINRYKHRRQTHHRIRLMP